MGGEHPFDKALPGFSPGHPFDEGEHPLNRAEALSIAIFAISLGGKVYPYLSKRLTLLCAFDNKWQEDAFWRGLDWEDLRSHKCPCHRLCPHSIDFAAMDLLNAKNADFCAHSAKLAYLAAPTAELAKQKTDFGFLLCDKATLFEHANILCDVCDELSLFRARFAKFAAQTAELAAQDANLVAIQAKFAELAAERDAKIAAEKAAKIAAEKTSKNCH